MSIANPPSQPETASKREVVAPQAAALTPSLAWRLPSVDGLRAFACLMVYLHHTWQFSGSPYGPNDMTRFGIDWSWVVWAVDTCPTAVDIFMVLCGFCLFWPLCKSPDAITKWSWTNYIYRRFRRICPPYYAAIAFVILFPQLLVLCTRLMGVPAKWQPNPSFGDILAHLTFTHTLFIDYWDRITGAFWTLGLEMQFYLIFPLVVFSFRRFRFPVIIAMVLISIVFRILVNWRIPVLLDQRLWTISFLGRWMQFAAGMTTALVAAHYYRRSKVLPGWIGSVLIGLGMIVYTLAWNGQIQRLPWVLQLLPNQELLLALACGLMIFAVTSTQTVFRHLIEFKPLVFLGGMSYSFFLIHQSTAWFFSEFLNKRLHMHGGGLHWFLTCTIGLAIVIALAYPFYLVFEKPFISAPKKKLKAPTTTPKSVVPASN